MIKLRSNLFAQSIKAVGQLRSFSTTNHISVDSVKDISKERFVELMNYPQIKKHLRMQCSVSLPSMDAKEKVACVETENFFGSVMKETSRKEYYETAKINIIWKGGTLAFPCPMLVAVSDPRQYDDDDEDELVDALKNHIVSFEEEEFHKKLELVHEGIAWLMPRHIEI